jgi:hypothetical protein
MRLLAALAALLALPGAAFAANPGLDASGIFHTSATSGSSYTLDAATTSAGDLIVISISTVALGSSAAPTVSSVTDAGSAGLSFSRRTAHANSYVGSGGDSSGGCYGGSACQDDDEEWCAYAGAALSSEPLTITLSGSIANISAAQGIGVTNPPTNSCSTAFAPSVPSPVFTSNGTGAASTWESSISVSGSNDVVLAFGSYYNSCSGVEFQPWFLSPDTEFTDAYSDYLGNGTYQCPVLGATTVSSAVSSPQVCIETNGSCFSEAGWWLMLDAVGTLPPGGARHRFFLR